MTQATDGELDVLEQKLGQKPNILMIVMNKMRRGFKLDVRYYKDAAEVFGSTLARTYLPLTGEMKRSIRYGAPVAFATSRAHVLQD